MTVPQGLSTISDPFISESNLVSQVLTNVPEGTQFYKFDAITQRWKVNQFQFGRWAWPQQTLAPGEGAFMRNPTNPFSITFTGTPPTNFAASASPGYNLLGVLADGTTRLNPRDHDLLHVWDSTQAKYSPILLAAEGIWYSPLNGTPEEPPLRAGESIFYYRSPTGQETVPPLLHSVYLNNYAPASGLDAPISSLYGCFGSTHVAQLYQGFGRAWTLDHVYAPIGDPVRLFASAGATYVDPQIDPVQVVTESRASGWFEIRVWDSRRGSYEAVLQGGGSLGLSQAFTIRPGSTMVPPVNLVGLKPFMIGPLTMYPWPYYASPTNIVVSEGQSAQLRVHAIHDLFVYQWQRETAQNTWADIAGATSRILVIPSVQKADAGRYRAVSTFDCASRATLPGVLTVIDRPELRSAIALAGNQTVKLGGFVPTGLPFHIEESYDLSHWTNFASFTSPPEGWSVLVTNVPEFSQRFFRVRLVP